jgi:hypothetical protein
MKNKLIFKYLDSQNFVVIENTDGIYFSNSENDEYAQIIYIKNNTWYYIYHKLVEEISSFFSIEESDSHDVIRKWVENTLQRKIIKNKLIMAQECLTIKNTLLMRANDYTLSIGVTYSNLFNS